MTNRKIDDDACVGVMVPTFNRPDFARACLLQLLAQTRVPDLVCFHQNGNRESYRWCIEDLAAEGVIWLHSPERLPQQEWYRRPLRRLLSEGCTRFFWADHDDIYRRHHIRKCLDDLKQGHDFTVARRCGLLLQWTDEYSYHADIPFTSHMPGGMSSSMCFNRGFATALERDLYEHPEIHYADNVVARITMPKFRCHVSNEPSTIYVAHEGTNSSRHWLQGRR